MVDAHSFGRHFYPHIPILEKKSSIPEMYEANRLLFWTVILVASKRHPKYSRLYRQLIDHYGALLGVTLLKPLQSISIVHAILILCLWPGIAVREAEDPSWHYCGLALNSAMQMSLHHARYPHSFDGFGESRTTEASAEVRALTWMACFQISTT